MTWLSLSPKGKEGTPMDEVAVNPIYIAFLFIIRCLVPLLILLGISALLRKFGLIKEPAKPPPSLNDGSSNQNPQNSEGGLAHGNP
jgi:hypothetical protein